jgi:hypothetical protein
VTFQTVGEESTPGTVINFTSGNRITQCVATIVTGGDITVGTASNAAVLTIIARACCRFALTN